MKNNNLCYIKPMQVINTDNIEVKVLMTCLLRCWISFSSTQKHGNPWLAFFFFFFSPFLCLLFPYLPTPSAPTTTDTTTKAFKVISGNRKRSHPLLFRTSKAQNIKSDFIYGERFFCTVHKATQVLTCKTDEETQHYNSLSFSFSTAKI